jgi:hypothetical protein
MATVDTLKRLSQKDQEQAIRQAQNDVNGTIGVDGFLTGLVGRQITQTISTTNVTGDTATFSFYENFGANLLYTFVLIYTDGTQQTLLSATRTA